MVAISDSGSKVVRIEPGDPRWNPYVESHERAYAYHLGQWAEILGPSYRASPRYLALESGGDLRGVLPLLYSRGFAFGRRLRSLPAVRTAGPLGTTVDDEIELLRAACEIAGQTQCRELIVHSRRGGYTDLVPGLEEGTQYPTWITPLPSDPEDLRREWRKHSKNLYRSLNRAQNGELTVRESRSERDLRSFYRLYLTTMKRRHSLPRPYKQIARARELLTPSGVFRLFVVEHRDRIVAGGVFHAFNGTLELQYNASDASALDLRPNHALYWHAMRWAIECGLQRFDWGEAKPGSGLEQFKAQWSAEPVPEFFYLWARATKPERATTLRQMGNMGRNPGPTRRQRIVAKAWDGSPPQLTRAAGEIVYRFL